MSAPIDVGSILGGFRLVRRIGIGGMGMVYAAQNLRVDKMQRAIKIIRPELSADTGFRQRFLQEAEFMEILQHPNILRVENVTEEDGVLFIVMELLLGQTVDEHLLAHPRLPIASVAHLMVGGLAGVAHAHRHSIFHRDLKPANLFITQGGQVKVLDFGIARHGEASGRITQSGQGIPGSPAYFAPEFVEGAAASAASDVYALGISLYELLTGDTPFKPGGGNDTQAAFSLVMQHVREPLPDVRQFRPDVPAPWLQLLARMTAKRPEHRPSASAVLDALQPFVGDGPPVELGKVTRLAPRSDLAGTPSRGVLSSNPPTPSNTLPLGLMQSRPPAAPSLPPTTPVVASPAPATPRPDLGRLTNLEFPNDDVIRQLAEETQQHQQQLQDAAQAGVRGRGGVIWGVAAAVLLLAAGGAAVLGVDHGHPPAPILPLTQVPPPRTEAPPAPVASPVKTPVGPVPAGMVAFKGGPLTVGRDPYGNARALDVPAHRVEVAPFALAITEVTTGDFKAFSDATGARAPWPPSLKLVERLAALPVVDVKAEEAEKFCRWRFGALGRLPTEEEWEWAARSGTSRRYPSGNNLKRDCLNAFTGETGILQPVGSRRCGNTPEGLEDLSGNAAEWTASVAQPYPGSNAAPPSSSMRVVRGGSFATMDPDDVTVSARQFVGGASRFVGFRCAASTTLP